VGNPQNNVTIRQFAVLMCELFEELTGERCPSPMVDITGEEFYGPGYEDSDRLPPDIRRMQALGWKPRRDLPWTLRDAMSYYLASRRKHVVRDLRAAV
jgi:UDP-apiose/xylose synthase